jgi:hypothetical protein
MAGRDTKLLALAGIAQVAKIKLTGGVRTGSRRR